MKNIRSILLPVTFFLMVFSVNAQEKNEILAINAKAPKANVEMQDVSGEMISLNNVKQENGLLVIFSCNTCPFVVGNGKKSEGWQGRYPELAEVAAKNKIGFVLLNPNKGSRDSGDSMEDMQEQYAANNYSGFYALDKDHQLADAFGALTTPHVYLFNSDMKLVYKGAIDDNVSDSKAVKETYLKDAINTMISGEKINPNSTRQLGCSIKRVSMK